MKVLKFTHHFMVSPCFHSSLKDMGCLYSANRHLDFYALWGLICHSSTVRKGEQFNENQICFRIANYKKSNLGGTT